MKILALESSGFSGEVALLDGDTLIVEQALTDGQRTAQALAPAIAAALEKAKWRPRDVQLVAVTIGPGSFTGLRVGVTTAKTFAYAAGCDVLGIDTLEAVASQVEVRENHELWSVLDAQRSQLFATRFVGRAGRWHSQEPAAVVDMDAWLALLSSETLATGSGLKRLVGRLPPGVAVDESLWQPRAASVGRIAWRDYQAGRRDDLWKLAPVYLRPSAAEEKVSATRE